MTENNLISYLYTMNVGQLLSRNQNIEAFVHPNETREKILR